MALPISTGGGMGGGGMMPNRSGTQGMSGMSGMPGMSTIPTGQTLPPPLDFLPGVNKPASGLPPNFGN